MRIACPSCSTAYEVPDALLAAGPRLLRCTRCGTQFTAQGSAPPPPEAPPPESPPFRPPPPKSAAPPPPEAAPPEASPPEPAPEPPVEPLREATAPAEPPARPSTGPLAAAWLGSFALLGALLFATLHWRAEIAAAWPPAARLFAALGLG
jgi:predicted Zn finger-like uncharacterized protein